jgi:hypothetical protein
MLRLALIVGTGIEVTDCKNVSRFPIVRKADASLLPQGYSDFMISDFFIRNLDSEGASFDLEQTIMDFKKQGIIPADNNTDVKNGIYQNNTGEFLLSLSGMAKVITPRSEAVSLMAGSYEKLKVLEIENSSVPAAIGVFAMDGKNLPDSKQMIIIYSTEMMPEGMELSPNRNIIINSGGEKPLLLTGKLRAVLNLSTEKKYVLRALSVNGIRRECIPMTIQDGKWKISLDTSVLKNGPTTFFELIEDAKIEK